MIEGFTRTAHTLVPLVWELSRICDGDAGNYVHWGATTQNITQTGDLLQLRKAHRIYLKQLGRILAALADLADVGQVRQGGEDTPELLQVNPVRLAKLQQVAGLGDVLRGRSPMHIVAGIAVADAGQLPYKRHQGVRRPGETFDQSLASD